MLSFNSQWKNINYINYIIREEVFLEIFRGKLFSIDSILKYFFRVRDGHQLKKHLPSIQEALGLIPNVANNEKEIEKIFIFV